MNNTDNIITLSIVIPIYRGEHCISDLLEEIKPFTTISFTTKGLRYCVTEVILVHDCGPDNSAIILQGLKEKNTFTQVIWLARNYGQHPATLAGLASSSAEWVITMDEDGQQDPKDVANLLDYAVTNNLSLVYADPLNPPPHGLFRNVCSFIAKKIGSFFLEEGFTAKNFNSFRLIYGENARVIAAYCGYGIYLDIALRWVTNQIGYCPVTLREERRPSSYSLKSLVAHFWRMVITSGTRPLRFIAVLGLASLFISLLISLYALYGKFISSAPSQGWSSLLIVISFFSGLIMLSIGILAEFLAINISISLGRPLYIISSKPSSNRAIKNP